MTAFYNEIDPNAAAWLRELIDMGMVAPGVVDERSIVDIDADELKPFTQCHFFAGIGIWSYAARLAGIPDTTELWTGSCPCQPFSSAGNRKGTDDDRHLWPAWFELVRKRRPPRIFGEQVASADVVGKVDGSGENVWLDVVQADLESARYATEAVDLPAAGFGAPHIRQRVWFFSERLADTDRRRQQGQRKLGRSSDPAAGADRKICRAEHVGGCGRLGNSGSEPCKRNAGEFPEAQAASSDAGSSNGRHDNGHSDAGEAGRLANTTGDRLDERRSSDATKGGYGVIGDGADNRTNQNQNFWRSADWLGCRDGKFRPVEPGTFPLVDGTATGMGCGGDPSAQEVASTKEARSMRLKGYGNGIVPQVAAAFMVAAMSDAA